MIQFRLVQIVQSRGRFTELDRKRRELQLLFQRCDWNRRDLRVNLVRLGLALIPAPGPVGATGQQERENQNGRHDPRVRFAVTAAALQPVRRSPGDFPKDSRDDSCHETRYQNDRAKEKTEESRHRKQRSWLKGIRSPRGNLSRFVKNRACRKRIAVCKMADA